jgi:spermidine synthase
VRLTATSSGSSSSRLSRPHAETAPLGLLLALCFFSGASGLVYEVTWTRLAVLWFGATAPALAMVLACFMGGLGLGAALGGRWADRRPRPLAAYGRVELGIAGWALLLVIAQRIVPIGSLWWPPWLRAVVAMAAILPPTALMGATLPLLVRAAGSARSVGPVYGTNTAGAVVGALAAAFVAIERLGLSGAQAAALAGNALVGLVALALARRGDAQSSSARPPDDVVPTSPRGVTPLPSRVLAVAGLTGAAAMALEVLAIRALDVLTDSTVYAFGVILATTLVGIALGGLASRRIADAARVRPALALSLGALALGAALAPALLAVVALVLDGRMHGAALGDTLASLLGASAAVILLPMIASGVAFPLCVRAAHEEGLGLGRATGTVTLANTAGTVAGSLAGTFVVLEHLGLSSGLWLVSGAALGAAVLAAPRGARRVVVALGVVVLGVAVGTTRAGLSLPRDLYTLDRDWQIVVTDDDASASVMVARSRSAQGRFGLWLDGNYVAGTGGAHVLLAHLPMLRHGDVRRVLGACMGTGQTFGAIAEYGLDRFDAVELSPAVVRVARRTFARFDRGLFSRPTVHVRVDDVRRVLGSVRGRYDLVTAEPLQPWTRGTVTLYSREYYAAVRRALSPGGLAVQWIPLYELSTSDLRGMVATFLSVFPASELWLDHHDVILIGGPRLPGLDRRALVRGLAREHVRRDLASLHIDGAETLAGKRALGPRALARFARSGRIVLDDDPWLEASAPRSIGRSTEWRNLEALVRAWAPDARDPEVAAASRATRASVRLEIAEHAGLTDPTPDGLRALAIYPRQSQLFAHVAALVDRDARAHHPQAIARARTLLALRPDHGVGWVNLGVLRMGAGEDRAAEEAFVRAMQVDPATRVVALLDLGLLWARRGDAARARGAWGQVLALEPGNAVAREALDRLGP